MLPPTGIVRGVRGFFRGLTWLRVHPFYLLLLFVPMLLGVFFLAGVGASIWHYHDVISTYLLYEQPSGFWSLIVFYFLKILLYLAVIIISFLGYILFLNIISAPIYDRVSYAVERDILGRAPFEISFWQSLALIGEEIKKALLILTLNIGILLIPVVNILAPLVAAFCLGWEVYDFALARRGFTFRRRFIFVLRHGWTVLGLGGILIIPGLSVILLPLAIAGGTILAVEDLKE